MHENYILFTSMEALTMNQNLDVKNQTYVRSKSVIVFACIALGLAFLDFVSGFTYSNFYGDIGFYLPPSTQIIRIIWNFTPFVLFALSILFFSKKTTATILLSIAFGMESLHFLYNTFATMKTWFDYHSAASNLLLFLIYSLLTAAFVLAFCGALTKFSKKVLTVLSSIFGLVAIGFYFLLYLSDLELYINREFYLILLSEMMFLLSQTFLWVAVLIFGNKNAPIKTTHQQTQYQQYQQPQYQYQQYQQPQYQYQQYQQPQYQYQQYQQPQYQYQQYQQPQYQQQTYPTNISFNEDISARAQYAYNEKIAAAQNSAIIIDEIVEAKLFAQAIELQVLKAPVRASAPLKK